jgi:adenylate kinase family enzyme
LQGRRCIHVDFGLLLRRASAGWTAPGLLTRPERRVIDAVLRTGALLDDAHFPLARKLLREALARRPAQPPPCLVLNGLPRHAGQARAIEADAKVLAVAHLACAPSVAWRRIRTDAGGDRAGRRDDLPQAVRRRLALYRRRTAPLLAYYRARGVPIIRIAVEPDLSAHRMRDRLIRGLRRNRRWNRGLASDPDLCYE